MARRCRALARDRGRSIRHTERLSENFMRDDPATCSDFLGRSGHSGRPLYFGLCFAITASTGVCSLIFTEQDYAEIIVACPCDIIPRGEHSSVPCGAGLEMRQKALLLGGGL